jgi:hypothetical protein
MEISQSCKITPRGILLATPTRNSVPGFGSHVISPLHFVKNKRISIMDGSLVHLQMQPTQPVLFNDPRFPTVYNPQYQGTVQQQTHHVYPPVFPPPTQFPDSTSRAGWFIDLSRFFLRDAY